MHSLKIKIGMSERERESGVRINQMGNTYSEKISKLEIVLNGREREKGEGEERTI